MIDKTLIIDKNEFKTIHNSLCRLREESYGNLKISELVEKLYESMKPLYEQENALFSREYDYFDEIQTKNGFKSIWSLFDEVNVGEINEKHPFPNAEFLIYNNHWGEHKVRVSIQGDTWLDLWRAADSAIESSGDGHHIFIERFKWMENSNNTLTLQTGS